MQSAGPASGECQKGIGDYPISTYVRIVSALREFIFDESEYQKVKRQLMEAAFDDSYITARRDDGTVADDVETVKRE